VIEVLEPGPLASVQEPFGRRGWRRYGVPAGGAADPWSARLANLLAGNPEGAALIEVTLGGAAFRLDHSAVVAVTGGLEATVGGMLMSRKAAMRVPAGATVRLDPGDGARGYLAIGGGVVAVPVLGSAATDLRSGFGGHDGRALRAGDRLAIGDRRARPGTWTGHRMAGPIRVAEGPQPAVLEELVAGAWTVGVEADRTGVRLDGAPLGGGGEVPSMGLPLGAIQVPPGGIPIVMLADRPVTGGYTAPACVIGADVGRVAQLRTGDPVTFALVTREDALRAWEEASRALSAVEPIGPDDHPGWAGSHD
jgi:biotin-dependent carboxylase-like uncharacterized protein